MIYLDSCAMLKLIRVEEHSGALSTHLASGTTEMVSSELTKVEVCRTLIRYGQREQVRDKADHLLADVAKLPLNAVVDFATNLPGRTLRSLDALHLATAQLLGPALTEFITYDRRLAKYASDVGLPVVMPGVN